MKSPLWLLVLVLVVVLSACAPGANELAHSPGAEGHVAGFWLGVWHAIISPVTFVISLFNPRVQIYEVHNNGGWYNFGFMLGLGVVLGGRGVVVTATRPRARRS